MSKLGNTMSVSLNKIVKINPGVLGVGNNGNTLYGLMLTKNGSLPASQISIFNNADQVSTLFGGDAIENTLANVYFSGFTDSQRTPDFLYMAPYYTGETSASLQGNNISYLTVEQMRALSGAMTITIDGITQNIDGLNFNTVNSLSDVGSVLGDALGCTVVYSSATKGLMITSSKTGSASSIGFAAGLLATDLRLSSEQGAIQSPSTSGQTLTALLHTLRDQNTGFSSVFLSWTPSVAERLELAIWATSMQEDIAVIINDTDNAAITQSTGASFAEQISVKNYTGIVPVYNNLELCAFMAGIPASWDFTQTDGRFNTAFRRNPLVEPNVETNSVFDALYANGYNFMADMASATNKFKWLYSGIMASIYKWWDSWNCQIWMRRQLQYNLALCLQSKGRIPYNTAGQGIIQTAIAPAIQQFINFGAITTGVALDDTQVLALKAVGLSQSQINSIGTNGYFLQIKMPNPSVRVNRGSPEINFWYTDGQSVQKVNMNSIEIM